VQRGIADRDGLLRCHYLRGFVKAFVVNERNIFYFPPYIKPAKNSETLVR
jgi:hypothetical protein